MADREKVFDAIRNCVTEPKCKDCPWEDCEKIGCKRVTVPVTLLLDTLNLLKEQPKKAHWVKMRGMMPPEFTGHFECDNCGWHGKSFEREVDFAHCPGCGAEMSIGGLTAEDCDCMKTPFDQMLDDYLEATGGVCDV